MRRAFLFGVLRQSEAATALWIGTDVSGVLFYSVLPLKHAGGVRTKI